MRAFPRLAPAAVVAVGLALLGACNQDGAVEPPPVGAATYAPVLLVSPHEGGRFRQNDPTLGCPAHEARGHGFRVAFDWADVAGADRYRVVFRQRDARYPAIEQEVRVSEHEQTVCNAFVIDRNLADWTWKVAALGRITPVSWAHDVEPPRDTVLWSEERTFGFEPCRLADGRACNAPPAP